MALIVRYREVGKNHRNEKRLGLSLGLGMRHRRVDIERLPCKDDKKGK